MTPRWYQEEAINAVLFAWQEYRSVLLHSPTGSGKNFMAARIIDGSQPARCLMVGDQEELVFQPAEAIDRFAGIIPAIDKAKQMAPLTAGVVVASAQTLSRDNRLQRYPEDHFKFILFDEAHRFVKQKEKIAKYFHHARICGLTATPFRADLKGLGKWYEEIAYSLPMLDLIGSGFAPPYKLLRLPVEIDLAEVEVKRGVNGKDYDVESLSTTIAPYYEKVIELLIQNAANRHTIAFLPLIKSSEAFAALARQQGIQAVHVDGKSPDRDQILESFRRGRIQMLCNASVVATGVDIPIADCFVNLCPMRSPVEYQQRFGRVMRVLPGVIDDIPGRDQAEERRARIAASAKPEALIIDFLWQHDELGVYRPENMIAASAEEAQAIFEKVKKERDPVDILAMQKLVQQEKEALMVRRIEEVAARSGGRKVEPAAFGHIIGSPALMNYRPTAMWEMQTPTRAQLDKLAKWGINADQVDSKGLASKLMSALIHRFQYRLASVNQLRALQSLGLSFDPRQITSKQATQLIAQTKLARTRAPSI